MYLCPPSIPDMKYSKFISKITSASLLLALFIAVFISACNPTQNAPLPILGTPDAEGNIGIPDFQLINQDSQVVTQATFKNKVYVADFFFTSCPTICKALAKSMHEIYQHYEGNDKVYLLSHSIDYRRDSVPRLKRYEQRLGVHAPNWQFVTGKPGEIQHLAKYYMSRVIEDTNAPGGYDHSGYLVLVDHEKRIRAYVNGTKIEDIPDFIEKIDRLLASYEDSTK